MAVYMKQTTPLETVSTLTEALKNEHTKRILYATGIRRPSLTQRQTPHYRMPKLQANGGYLPLKKYDGPEIPAQEYEDLTYTTYSTDDATTFAPITSCTGELELKGFEAYGKPDLDGVWTENAKKCPTIVKLGRVDRRPLRPRAAAQDEAQHDARVPLGPAPGQQQRRQQPGRERLGGPRCGSS